MINLERIVDALAKKDEPVRKEFRTHKLSEAGQQSARTLAADFENLLRLVENTVGPDGREMDLCRQHLEQACFYAKKQLAQRFPEDTPAPRANPHPHTPDPLDAHDPDPFTDRERRARGEAFPGGDHEE